MRPLFSFPDPDALTYRSSPPIEELPLFAATGVDRLSPRLHHGIETCQAEEKRQRRTIGAKARAILNYLTVHGPHTRAELAEGTGIRIQSVCSTVDAMKRQGLVVQLEKIRNGGHLLVVTPGRDRRAT